VDSSVGTPINEARLINRLAWRLMPLLGLLYLVAYIDRQNISFAKLQMLDSLGMSEVAYGLGASLFFIGYLLFEAPSKKRST
jgi:sugar phosphate permease